MAKTKAETEMTRSRTNHFEVVDPIEVAFQYMENALKTIERARPVVSTDAEGQELLRVDSGHYVLCLFHKGEL